MRLTEIRTEKLFGIFDHVVPLKLDDRITIVHGPNGFGKTAILRLLWSIFNGRFGALRQLPFTTLRFAFDSGPPLVIDKALRLSNDEKTKRKSTERVLLTYGDESTSLDSLTKYDPRTFPYHIIDEVIPILTRVAGDEWIHDQTGELLGVDDVILRYSDRLPFITEESQIPKWLSALNGKLHVHYIQAHRLETRESKPSRPREAMRPIAAVTIYAAELASQIQSTLARYADVSSALDRTFPARLVSGITPLDLSVEELYGKLKALEEKRRQLTGAGLLDKEGGFLLPLNIEESKRGVLSVYVVDADKKLAVFDDLYSRINLFKTIINERFLFKEMSIDKQDGIVFRSKKDLSILPATSLSTGEQHEVVLLYELLFRVQKDALILIDEPEISLHIGWQQQFLKDLEQITALSRFDVLIATHSPQIISNRWDLTVELKGPAE